MTSRGIRNNNPMNIRISPNKWEGKITPNTDGVFEQFKTPEDGIRAGVKLLLVYNNHYGLNTVRQIINRFAPNNENDTSSYAKEVAKDMGVELDSIIDVDDYDTALKLVKAIIDYENAGKGIPYSDDILRNALKRAGIYNTPNKSVVKELAKDPTTQITTVAVVSQVVNTVAPVNDLLIQMFNFAPWAVLGIVALIVGYIIWQKIKPIKEGRE